MFTTEIFSVAYVNYLRTMVGEVTVKTRNSGGNSNTYEEIFQAEIGCEGS